MDAPLPALPAALEAVEKRVYVEVAVSDARTRRTRWPDDAPVRLRRGVRPRRMSPTRLAAAAATVFAIGALPGAHASECRARAAGTSVPLVELYTSEGCSSCPPADRWLSGFKNRRDVVALAFHVNYWDHLGWHDRFGSAAFAQRQAREQRVNGARYSYTPQVVIDGRDRPDWPGARIGAGAAARVTVTMLRDGPRVQAQVETLPGAPEQLAGYWAITEDDHASAVRAGENAGETLRHDFVVREHRPIAAWNARPGEVLRLEFTPSPPDEKHPQRIALVITDASGKPLQALQLGPC